jgi:hypothetical protein
MGATIQIVLVLTLIICIYDHIIDPLYVVLLALFNDVTMSPISSDNAIPSRRPDIPTVKYLLGMATMFGILVTIQTMIYYHFVNLWDRPVTVWGTPLDYGTSDNGLKLRIRQDGTNQELFNVWKIRSSATYVQIR